MGRVSYYPLFADLAGKLCVVVGGGAVAQRKIMTLLGCGAKVTVVSPEAGARLVKLSRNRKIRFVNRRFRGTDLRGAWLVFAATDDEQTNKLVFRTAARLRILANVVDQPRLCSFIAPSVVKRGLLTIAISTSGASPSAAKQLRRELQKKVGPDYARLLQLLQGLRAIAKKELPGYGDRKQYFEKLINGRVFRLIRGGKIIAARREALALLRKV